MMAATKIGPAFHLQTTVSITFDQWRAQALTPSMIPAKATHMTTDVRNRMIRHRTKQSLFEPSNNGQQFPANHCAYTIWPMARS